MDKFEEWLSKQDRRVYPSVLAEKAWQAAIEEAATELEKVKAERNTIEFRTSIKEETKWRVIIVQMEGKIATLTAENERLRKALTNLKSIPAVRHSFGNNHTENCGCPLCIADAVLKGEKG